MKIEQLLRGLDAFLAENRGKNLKGTDAITYRTAADLRDQLRNKKRTIEESTFRGSVRSDEISFAPGGGCPCCGK